MNIAYFTMALRIKRECGGAFNTSLSTLVSSGSALWCSWTLVTVPSVCGFALDLGDLSLPPCPSDRLVVGGVSLCGDLRRVIHLPVTSPRTNVTFRGNPDGGPGLNISVHHIECGDQLVSQVNNHHENPESFNCEGEFYGDNVVIESPGYPLAYPPDAQCRYTIRQNREEVCQVEITFENSTLEDSVNCYKDRLEIQGDRLCGDLNGVRTFSIDDVLDIRFVSDSDGSEKGFKLLVTQLKCEDTPIVVDASEENDKQDVLIDCGPEGSMFPNVAEGYPKERRPFPPFPTLDVGNRNYPPLQNYPAPQNGFRGIPPYQPGTSQFPFRYPSYFNPPQQDYSPPKFLGHPTQRPFQQNSNVPNSFKAIPTYPPFYQTPFPHFPQSQQCCGRIYTDSHFLIVSPGFPQNQASDCIYTIQRYSPLTIQLRFQFRYFWVGQDTDGGCIGGALEIDGNRVCGCKTGIIWTSPLYDSESVKVLRLRMDSSARLFNGFVLEVYQDDSYSGRSKRGQTDLGDEQFTMSNGSVVNFTQYVETFIEREPLGININYELDRTHSQLVWDPHRKLWTLPTNWFCLRWSYQDWILLAKEALWSQYQCPSSDPSSSIGSVDASRFDVTACRTCHYFCRQNCQCC